MKMIGKILGWIFIPYVMIFVQWKILPVAARVFGGIWAGYVFISFIGSLIVPHNETPSAEPASTSIQQQANSQDDSGKKAQEEADKKAKEEAERKAKEEATIQAKAEADAKRPRLNEVAQVGKFSVAISDKFQKTQAVGGAFGSQAKGVYWMIPVAIRNDDKKARMIDSSMFTLIGPDGAKYDPDTTGTMDANMDANNNGFFLDSINPGINTAGWVVFDMPTNINISDFIMRVYSGVGFAAGSNVDFVLQHRDQ